MATATKKHRIPKWLKWLFIGAISLLVLFVLVVAYALTAFFTQRVDFAVPLPHDWRQTSQTGSIAGACMGSWEECGVILRTYDTDQTVAQAESQARAALQAKGWVVSSRTADETGDVRLVAHDHADNWEQNASISLYDGRATASYVHR